MVAPLLALLLLVVLRLLAGPPLDGIVVRDAAPYAYALAGLLALVPTGTAAARRTTRALAAALVLHAAWVTLVVLLPGLPGHLPLLGGRVRVLEVRPDFDGAVLAVLAGLALRQVLRDRRRARRLAGTALVLWPSVLVLEVASRAALAALAAAVLVVLVADRGRLRLPGRRTTALGALALLAAAFVLVPRTHAYQRIRGDREYAANTTAGSQAARIGAWRDVVDYLGREPQRVLVGVGFGPDFVWESGAATRLEGVTFTGVRAPHSYLLNTYGRLGLVGTATLLWLLAAVAAALRRPVGGLDPQLLSVATLLAVTVLVVAMVGVVLEAPFGAVPFFWAGGLILTSGRPAGPGTT